ncbi:hypothetical protein PR048_026248 [Dryococelus australis]|uniref:Uncharacterized protein n=1 Tax=Dryococelus australis TaxID=614101 RepID=A0ABQ9GKT0_9NEOP|nr:hypothetical protein PR048_026248 [Dryococelus australis]
MSSHDSFLGEGLSFRKEAPEGRQYPGVAALAGFPSVMRLAFVWIYCTSEEQQDSHANRLDGHTSEVQQDSHVNRLDGHTSEVQQDSHANRLDGHTSEYGKIHTLTDFTDMRLKYSKIHTPTDYADMHLKYRKIHTPTDYTVMRQNYSKIHTPTDNADRAVSEWWLLTARSCEPMRVIEVGMERRGNEKVGENGRSRENPPTDSIVRHDSHLRKSGVTRPGFEPGSPWWETSMLTAQPPLSTANRAPYKVLPKIYLHVQRGENGAAPEGLGGETGDPRENPPTSGIARYDSRVKACKTKLSRKFPRCSHRADIHRDAMAWRFIFHWTYRFSRFSVCLREDLGTGLVSDWLPLAAEGFLFVRLPASKYDTRRGLANGEMNRFGREEVQSGWHRRFGAALRARGDVSVGGCLKTPVITGDLKNVSIDLVSPYSRDKLPNRDEQEPKMGALAAISAMDLSVIGIACDPDDGRVCEFINRLPT